MWLQAQSPNTLSMRRPLPQLTLDEELPDCLLPDLEATPQEELEKAEMIHVRCGLMHTPAPSYQMVLIRQNTSSTWTMHMK